MNNKIIKKPLDFDQKNSYIRVSRTYKGREYVYYIKKRDNDLNEKIVSGQRSWDAEDY